MGVNKYGSGSAKAAVLKYLDEKPGARWKDFQKDMPGRASKRSFARYLKQFIDGPLLPLMGKLAKPIISTPKPHKASPKMKENLPRGGKIAWTMRYLRKYPKTTYTEFLDNSGRKYSENTFYHARARLREEPKKLGLPPPCKTSFVPELTKEKETGMDVPLMVKLFLISGTGNSYTDFRYAYPEVQISDAYFYLIRKKLAEEKVI